MREGYRADLVLFEENGIRPCLPTVERDFPGGARRLVQKAEGIKATLVNGAVAFENGATGAQNGAEGTARRLTGSCHFICRGPRDSDSLAGATVPAACPRARP